MDYALNEFYVMPFDNGNKVLAYLDSNGVWLPVKANYEHFELLQEKFPEGFRRFHSSLNAYLRDYSEATQHPAFDGALKMSSMSGKSASEFLIEVIIPTHLEAFNRWVNKKVSINAMLAIFFREFAMFPFESEPVEWVFQNKDLRIGILMCASNVGTPFYSVKIESGKPPVLSQGFSFYAYAYKKATELLADHFNKIARQKLESVERLTQEEIAKRVEELTDVFKKEAKKQDKPESQTRA